MISSATSRFPALKSSSIQRRVRALFSSAKTLICSVVPLLSTWRVSPCTRCHWFPAVVPLRTWRPSSLTRCHCVTTAATIRAIVANVMKRLLIGLFASLPSHAPHRSVSTYCSKDCEGMLLPRKPPYLYVGCPGTYPGCDAQRGRGWLEKASPSEIAVEELPLGHLCEETPTAYRDQREFAM